MSKNMIITGVVILIILVLAFVGFHFYKASSSQSDESSVSSNVSTKTPRPYSKADNPNDPGIMGHIEKGMEHFGL